MPPGVAITVIANLNFHGQDIPSDIFRRLYYNGNFGQDERSVLKEVFGRIDKGRATIDRPVREDVGDFVLQYNFIRGYRPRREARKVDTPLDAQVEFDSAGKPKGFNYTLPEIDTEHFTTRNLDGISVDFLFNSYPFAPGHFVFVPNRKPKDAHIHNQYLDPKSDATVLEAAWHYVVSGEYGDDIRLAYNSLGAHASVNQLHLQGFFLTQDWQPPFEKVLGKHDGSSTIDCYFQGARWITASEGLNGIKEFLTEMNRRWETGEKLAFNMYLTPKGVACFPRKHQGDEGYFSQLQQSPFTTGYAFFEMLGEIISPVGITELVKDDTTRKDTERRIQVLYDSLSVK